jgi:hypothetical protein
LSAGCRWDTTAFHTAANRLGLTIAGSDEWDPNRHDYRELARRIAFANVEAVYLATLDVANGSAVVGALRQRLGRPGVSPHRGEC